MFTKAVLCMSIMEPIPSHYSHKGEDKDREGVSTSKGQPIVSVANQWNPYIWMSSIQRAHLLSSIVPMSNKVSLGIWLTPSAA